MPEIKMDSHNRQLYEAAQTRNTDQIQHPTPTSEPPKVSYRELFKYNAARDDLSEVRNILLVVATLITTATFEASLSPPKRQFNPINGPEDQGINKLSIFEGFLRYYVQHVFLIFNTLAFTCSLYMINILIKGFPLRRALQVCMVGVIVTYAVSLLTHLSEASFYIVSIILVTVPMSICAADKAYRRYISCKTVLPKEQPK